MERNQIMNSTHQKNIGIVTSWFERGAAYVSRQIMQTLQDDYNVFIYARGGEYPKDNPKWDLDNVTWGKKVYLPGPVRIDKKDFMNWLVSNSIDTVIFNEQRWWQPIIWAIESGVVTGCYVDYYTEENLPLFQAYDFLICNTEKHYSVFESYDNAHLVEWGTDVNLFKPKALNDKDPVLTFFHSAGYSPHRKGTDLLIKAFDKIKQDYKTRLVIHSQRDISYLVEDYEKIKIINKTVSAPGLYHKGDIYVYPSRLDGIGLTICEALACGLPVITTDNKPMSEFILDNINGLLVEVENYYERSDGYYWKMSDVNVESLAQKMEFFIKNRSSLPHFKKAARSYAKDRRDWMKNSQKIKDIIEIYSEPVTSMGKKLKNKIRDYDRNGWGKYIDIVYQNNLLYYIISNMYKLYSMKKRNVDI